MSEQTGYDEVVVEEAVVAPQASVGELLAEARKARGLTVIDVAQTLKLGTRQVEALENGDWQGLPGQTFVRGFVRNYARMVQIDSAPLMALLDGVLEKPVNSLAVPDVRPTSMPVTGGSAIRRDRVVVLTGAGLVVLAALAYFLMPNDLSAWRESTQGLLDSLARKEEPAPVPVSPPVAPEPVFPPGATPQQVMNPQALVPGETPPAAATPDASAPKTVVSQKSTQDANAPQMRFVFEKESWLEVRDRDNKLVFSQRLAAGTEQVLSGEGPLSLVIGFAPGVRLFWHGQSVDLAPHTRGDVARLVLE